jgi:S-DNA-T family DNA segregation ATPase FtsK/SpoIIIE
VRLKFTLARTAGPAVDLEATVDATVTVGDLAAALDRCDPDRGALRGARPEPAAGTRLSLRVHSGGTATGSSTVLSADLPLAVSGVRSGSLLSLASVGDRWQARGAASGSAAASLTVLSGPDAGQEFPLREGTSLLGRDVACDVRLTDPLVSKRHARITITDVAEIMDTGSANGLLIGGSPTPRAVVRSQDRVIVGETAIAITVHRTAAASLAQTADVDFNRSPRLDPTLPGAKFVVPDPPETPHHQVFPLIAMIAPLVMGVALYAFTRSLLSILFIGLSPLLMIGNYIDNRIQNRRAMREAERSFGDAVRQLRDELAGALARERVARLLEAPSTAEAMDAIRRQTPLLWTRRREHERILTVRLGVGTQPSRHEVELPRRGRAEPRHWAMLQALHDGAVTVQGVPVVADLRACGSVGICGPRAAAAGVARGTVVQLVALHSPADLVVTALVSGDSAPDWAWLKWLPHNKSPYSPVNGPHLAADASAGLRLTAELEELIAQRSAGDDAPTYPAVVVIVEDDAPVERARLVGLAENGPAVGVHAVWVSGTQERLPAACRTFLAIDRATNTVTAGFVTAGAGVAPLVCETVTADEAMTAARSLAPVSDAGVRIEDDSDLPRSVSFLSLVGTDLAQEPSAVIDRWRESESVVNRSGGRNAKRRNLSLRAVVGQGAAEPLTIDLRGQGPHALVGGTTGSGKSEFLQSWVLGLAAGYSPDTLTFLFVDYKGGAAFADCINLPHSVGLVTDLSPHLVRRALTSLNAELRHREEILHAKGAKDLLDLHRAGDPDAPPSLIIVVDEFAALAHDVPEFVDGVVNVAQRGRSLGLHLILATQRPAGVIKDNLRANTNLRVALRMADESDSTDVLGVPVAATFSPDIPGRGAAKIGPGRINGFQTGYVGGWTSSAAPAAQLGLHELTFGPGRRWEEPETPGGAADAEVGPKDITRLVGTVSEAARQAQIPAPRKPWLPVLAEKYDLQFLNPRRDNELPIGVIDDPDRQEQRPVFLYPDLDGNLAVYGTGGSGKSTVLRTLAIAAGITPRSGPCQVYGIDFGSAGLRLLEPLPHVGSIIAGEDAERVERLVRMLKAELDGRIDRYSAVQADTITDYRKSAGQPGEPRFLLLIDGFAAFRDRYESSSRDSAYSLVQSIAADGRSVGLHVLVSADRPGAIPGSFASTIQRRIVLRLAEEGDYGMLGASKDVLSPASPPGRGVIDGFELQVAVLVGSVRTASQAVGVDELARSLTRRGITSARSIGALPDQVYLSDLPAQAGSEVVVGVRDDTLGPFGLDLTGPMVLSGPPQSGRTTALAAIAAAVRRARPAVNLTYLGSKFSALTGLGIWDQIAGEEGDVESATRELVELIKSGTTAPGQVAVIIEGVTEYSGSKADQLMANLVDECRRHQQFVIGEAETSALSQYGDLPKALRASRRGILLQPSSEDGDNLLRTPLPPRTRRADFPPGRGFFVAGGRCLRVQIARPE